MLDYSEEQEYELLETAVLGAIVLENWAFDLVSADLKPHCFQNHKCRDIYQAIFDLKGENSPIDIRTIAGKLKSKGLLESVGGSYYIASLTERIASPANIEYHARIILQQHLKREFVKICSKGMVLSNDRGLDIFDLYESTKADLDKAINEVTSNKGFDTIATIGDKFVENLNDIKSGIIEASLSYGLIELDKYGGCYPSDLIYVGARPGMGKTAFIIKVIRTNVIDKKKPIGVFSLEMPNAQLLRRIVSAELEINGESLRTGDLTHGQITDIHNRVQEWKKLPLYMDDKTTDIDMLCIKARQMKRLYNIEELIIDYLGFITAPKYAFNKNAEITYISKRLKMLAKELNIPIICLSQLSRQIEERPLKDRMPRLHDLRDSGSIEQDADQVIFLFRPDYYYVDTFEVDGKEIYTRGKCFIIIAKNRHGVMEQKLVGFKGIYTEFFDLPESLPASDKQLALPVSNDNPIIVRDYSQPTGKNEDNDDLPF